MNWEDVRLFHTAAEARSMTIAAKMLGLSQPQVSRRLRQLESRLNARLFDRTPSGLLLTAAGERLLPLAREMKQAADAVDRAGPGLAQAALTTVRLSVDEVREHFICTNLGWLKARLPGIDLEIHAAHQHLNHASRETEIQLRSCMPETETLVARRLGSINYAVYGSRDYLDAHPSAFDDRRYTECDWVGLASDKLWYPEQKQWLDKRLNGAPHTRCNTMTALLAATRAGAGLALLPCFMAEELGDLQRVTDQQDVSRSVENLIVHRDLLREPAVRTAVDAIAALFKKKQKQLDGSVKKIVAAA